MPPSLTCLLLAAGLLCVVVPASSIICYQCNSQVDDGCADIHFNDTDSDYLKECDGDYEGEQPFCRKTVQELKLHPPRVIRGCGWKNHTLNCYHSDDSHHIEMVCQCFTDACNHAATCTASIAAALLLAGVALLRVVA